jgi:hypothetical protein
MNSIVNKDGETIAYLYQNAIIDVKKEKLLGVVLGNCIFGKSKSPVGKFFNDKFRKKNGKIVAQLGKKYSRDNFPENDHHLILEAWKSLSQINDHICMWVDDKKDWASNKDFLSLLKEKD